MVITNNNIYNCNPNNKNYDNGIIDIISENNKSYNYHRCRI